MNNDSGFLTRTNLLLSIACYVAIVAALYSALDGYVVIFGMACVCWRIAHYYDKLPLLKSHLLTLVSLSSCVITLLAVYAQGLFTILMHLIFLGFSLKFLELRSARDVHFFVNTGLVLIALFFIFHTSLSASLTGVLLLLLLLSLLLSLQLNIRARKLFTGLLFKSCLLSVPLALLLFVTIPRLPSLWKVPTQKQATTGLSDRVSPGEIAKLSRSSALAFRATFDAPVVAEKDRYWRAMTLDSFDGKSWFQSAPLKHQEADARRGKGNRFYSLNNAPRDGRGYQLIVEPHYNYWLPVLDYALTPKGMVSLKDFSLRSDKPIQSRRAFNIEQISSLDYLPLTSIERRQFTQLPLQSNPQTDAWITTQLQQGSSKQQILQQLLQRYASNFRYTLSPPTLSAQQVDDFLFSTKAGFCVHYASSYLYVARRLGIPARMVTGYLGGEWQEKQNFLTLRQYDAHAWVELWQGGQWQRVDPTAYVAPERVESGLQAGLSDANEFLADEYFSLHRWQSVAMLNHLRLYLAQVDYWWARYVVNFDNQMQHNLLRAWLAKVPWMSLAYSILAMMGLIFVALLLVIFKPWQRRQYSAEDRLLMVLQTHFDKRGCARQQGQTVSDYCNALAALKLAEASTLEAFAQRYNALKYQPDLSPQQRKAAVKQLRTTYQLLSRYKQRRS